MKRTLLLVGAIWLAAAAAFGQANGKLQIHYIDVGQGDAEVLISPHGEVVLFDDGARDHCDKPLAYLAKIGVTKVDVHIASHYHDDHIGCTQEVLTAFPLAGPAYDRGGSYTTTSYTKYVQAVGSHRATATTSTVITLDQEWPDPVTISIVALNGNGVPTTNENDLSVVAVVRYGHFRAELGGDLSGFDTGSYADIETSVAPLVGRIDVYKVHHHSSRYSTNDAWLATTTTRIGIISVGDGNSYGFPTADCLARLHAHGVHTYWTEAGAGVAPDAAFDEVAGSTVVEVAKDAAEYTVTIAGGAVDVYPTWDVSTTPTPTPTETPTPTPGSFGRVRRHLTAERPPTPTPTPTPTPSPSPAPAAAATR